MNKYVAFVLIGIIAVNSIMETQSQDTTETESQDTTETESQDTTEPTCKSGGGSCEANEDCCEYFMCNPIMGQCMMRFPFPGPVPGPGTGPQFG